LNEKQNKRYKVIRQRTVQSDKEAFPYLIVVKVLYIDILYRDRRALSSSLAPMALIRQQKTLHL